AVACPGRAFGDHQGDVVAVPHQRDAGRIDAFQHQLVDPAVVGFCLGDGVVAVAPRIEIGVGAAGTVDRIVPGAAADGVGDVEAVDDVIAGSRRLGEQHQPDLIPIPA